MSSADEISKWKKLFDEGTISEEEFNKQKDNILYGQSSKPINNNIFYFLIGSIVLFATFIFSQNIDTQTGTVETEVNTEVTAEPLEELSADASLVVDSIEEISMATVLVEAEGTFTTFNEEFNIVDVEVGGWGSGFLISSNGYIVTNNHVVAGASIVKVYFAEDDNSINAQVVAQSECSDLALLKIDRDEMLYFDWAKGTPNVGDEIYAAGYPLGDPEFTLLDGIVTKKEADGDTPWSSIESTFEHNAEIKSGNSGGPVVGKSDFKVYGVNYATDSENQEFAINNDIASRIINSMIGRTSFFRVKNK